MALCDKDCNHCQIIGNENSRMISFILNSLLEKFGDGVYDVVQSACPNLTCCFDCRIDDFCHVEGCEIKAAVEEKNEQKIEEETPSKYHYKTTDLFDADPNCVHNVVCAPGGGVKCAKCPGWFCF